MSDKIYQVLFLCTGNSAGSILAEPILSRRGGRCFLAHHAGSHPKSQVHPMALEVLRKRGHDISALPSGSGDSFAKPGAAALDFVVTVCGSAAGEACPVWPGQPMTAHRGVEDSAALEGSADEQRGLFRRTYEVLKGQISLFSHLSVEFLDRVCLQMRLNEIKRTEAPAGASR